MKLSKAKKEQFAKEFTKLVLEEMARLHKVEG